MKFKRKGERIWQQSASKKLEKKYDSSYADFIKTLSNEERLKGVEKISQNWEGDVTEWEYWEKELEEWKMRLEDILMKS